MKFNLDLKGLDQLTAKLDRLADEKQAVKITTAAYKEGAKPILAAAKANIPVDTGYGRRHLKIKARRRRGRISVTIGEGSYKGQTFYLAMVEYGHRVGKAANATKAAQRRARHFKGRGELAAKAGINLEVKDTRRQVPAKPFLRPAVDTQKETAEQTIIQYLAAAIDTLFKA